MRGGAPARIGPGTRREIGIVNLGITRLLGLVSGGAPPHVFTTLARHRRLFRRWLRFAGGLMPGGLLPRTDSELVILRVAHNCACDYEWLHHERLGRLAGLSAEDVQRVRSDPETGGWPDRRALLLAAADELHRDRTISDALWSHLATLLSARELIELCLLVGHYEMLAMTLNALRVQPDPVPAGSPPRAMRTALRLLARRRGAGASIS